MTTTYAAVNIVANGKPYIFSVDATDGSANTAMVNVVSNRGLGDTFSGGATITALGPVTLNSSGGAGASKSALDKVIRVLSDSIALGYTTRQSDKLLKIYNDIGEMKKKLG